MANPFLRELKAHSRGGDHEGKEEEVGECGPQDQQMDHLAQLPHLKGLGQGSLKVFCKGQNSEYFRLCGPYGIICGFSH